MASVSFVQSDLLGVGFAGAVVRLAPQSGAGPSKRWVSEVDQTPRWLGLGRGTIWGAGGEHVKYTRTSVGAQSLRATAE